MIKVLVIGSKGFIGNYAYKYFSNINEYTCWGCDVVVDYIDENYFLIDSSNSDFNEIFETISFDVCVNCSGAASVPDSLKHPFRDFSLNTFNVVKILEAIRKHAPQCKFVNLSSAAVYGNPKVLPITETSNCQPVSPYGKHKLFAEELCKEYYEYFGVQSSSLRVFSAYGPGLTKQIFWDIFQKSIHSKDVNLFGKGNETRDFVFVEDILQAINLVIKYGQFNAASYNVASGQETSIKEAAIELLNKLNFKGNIVFSGSERAGDPINWQADIKLLKKLGYEPKYSVSEGVKKYAQWLKEEKLH